MIIYLTGSIACFKKKGKNMNEKDIKNTKEIKNTEDKAGDSSDLFQRSRELAKIGKYKDGLSIHDVDTDPEDDLKMFNDFNLVKNYVKMNFHKQSLQKLKANSEDFVKVKK